MTINLALIPLLIREEMNTDPWGTLTQVAEMGYHGVEIGSGLMDATDLDAAAVKQRLTDLGLQTFAYGTSIRPGQFELTKIIDEAQALACPYVVTYYAPSESRAQILEYAALFNEVGAALKKHNLTFCYHNHDHEFTNTFDGERGIDILFNNTDPELVQAEVDVAWVQVGGFDPLQHLEAFTNRCPIIHIKDVYSTEFRGAWTEIGTGLVNIKGAIETGLRCGARWFVVEQDKPRDLPPMQSTRASIDNLKAMGLV